MFKPNRGVRSILRWVRSAAARHEEEPDRRALGRAAGVVIAGANVHDVKPLEATIKAIVVDRPDPDSHLRYDKKA